MGTGELETGIIVDFNEPRLEALVDHEIQTKHLEIVQIPFRIYH